jgi:CDGSH iron-sulfur domain-containing protein 3
VTERQIAQKAPYPVDVEAGRTYYWCACGQSKKQPFCDGSHKDTGITPVAWTAEKTHPISAAANSRKTNRSAMAATPSCDGNFVASPVMKSGVRASTDNEPSRQHSRITRPHEWRLVCEGLNSQLI